MNKIDKSVEADARRFRWILNGNGYFMEEEMLCGHSPCSQEEQDDARSKIDEQTGDKFVLEYKGRIFTEGRAPNGQPIIHYFEDGKEYGLVNDGTEAIINALKSDIDHRDKPV